MSISVTYPFDTPANYTLSGITLAAGLAALTNLRPADVTFSAEFSVDEDARIFDTDGTGTLVNGATVASSELDLRGGVSGRRCAYNGAEAAAGFQEQATIRIRYRPNYSGVPAADRWLFGAGEAVGNVNAIGLYHRSGGGVPGHIVFQIYDQAGVSLHGAASPSAWLPVAGQEYEIEVNYDITAGTLRIFIDGVLFYQNLAIGTGTRSATPPSRFNLGVSKALNNLGDGQIGSFQIFDAVQHTSDYTPNAIGVEGIPPDYYQGTIEVNDTLQAEELLSFSVVDDETGGTIRYGLLVNGVLTYWDGAAWSASDGSLAQLNTPAEINANLSTLALAPASYVQAYARIESADGTATPSIDSISITYDYGAVEPAPSDVCEVYGFVRDMAGQPVEGCVVTASPELPLTYVEDAAPTVVLGRQQATTDSDGRFEINLIQGLIVRFDFETADGEVIRYQADGDSPLLVTVPAADVADIATLLP